MSTPAQKANLARIRDNQRRSRARRREYVQELEQRLRLCELQGVEASAEVQVAARRVAEENRHLRDLLTKQGFSDEAIAHYLQSTAAKSHERVPTAQLAAANSGVAVHSLQHLMGPRRAASLEQSAAFALPGQAQTSRETSINSASTASSSVWEPPQQGLPPTSFAPSPSIGVGAAGLHAAPSQDSYPIFSTPQSAPMQPFLVEQQGQLSGNAVEQQSPQHGYANQHVQLDHGTHLPYNASMDPYSHPPQHSFGPPDGY